MNAPVAADPTAPGLIAPVAHVADRGDKAAVIMGDTGATMTYAELDATAWRIARALRTLGVEPGAHVALCVENRIELPALLWGCQYAGVYYTWISTRLAPAESAHIVRDCAAKVLIGTAKTLDGLRAGLRDDDPDGLTILSLDQTADTVHLGQLMARQSAEPIAGATEGRDMLYSSGTTGRPKGVKKPLTGLPVGSPPPLAGLLRQLYGVDGSTVYLAPAPFYHAAVCRWVHVVTGLGATVVLMAAFDAETALVCIERYGVTHSQWVPTMFRRILGLPAEVRNRYDTGTHRCAVHAAAPCPRELKLAMFDLWGPILHEYYAGTEGIGMTHCGPQDWLAHPGSVGRPVLGRLHIIDRDGTELPPGEEGLICFSDGPQFEYHHSPEATAAAHPSPGLSTMGDIGRVDEDGFLHLTDRATNMIISGGVNIYPQACEDLLQGHPAVADAAVIGVPNPEYGEEVLAVVQTVDGGAGSDKLAAELIAYCRERLSPIACPRRVEFHPSLPREPTGKLRKKALRDPYWADRTGRLV